MVSKLAELLASGVHQQSNFGTSMLRLVCFLFVGFIFSAGAAAMTFVVQGNSVFATGPVVGEDYIKFVAVTEQPGVERVVLLNSPGGDLWTGMTIGRRIAEKGLSTVAAGYCASACSIIFLGGKERTFSDAFRPDQTYIGIHGPHDKDTKIVSPQQAGQIYAFYKLRMGDKFNSDVINKALYSMQDAGSLLRVFDPKRLPARVTYHCVSSQSLRKDCTEFKDQDALTLGIITSSDLTKIEVPEKLREIPKIFGRELNQGFLDLEDFYRELMSSQCASENCRRLIVNFRTIGLVNAKENKALAVPVTGQGLGVLSDQASPEMAFFGAIYHCNHGLDRAARLCETQVVNDFDLRGFYSADKLNSIDALAKLAAPSEKFFANEEYGGGMTSAKGLRTQKLLDSTPQKIDGIQTFGTQALVLALKGVAPPVLIDVGQSGSTLPGAQSLLRGGFAFDDTNRELAYQARFHGLLKLLSPDASAPIIFFAKNREWWHGVNAAMRAKNLGYAQVGWYRGGLDSWQAAGLPVVPTIVRAVAN